MKKDNEYSWKKIFEEYTKNEDIKEDLNKFRAGYYRRNDDCAECLQCIGTIAVADTCCECAGGDLCSCI
ncbi:hypothetical protein [Marinitoga litoralis]|jgi:hypothetical protein|uniref:hypothetical protein n=1 Tax=Marinitoga litoralis TaxID=570855 RepID=UPI001961014E|nr:hypothetical protein [Marinitoga litoralis]MBM7559273.1 hypothetical protein [Marinitoga litoralis]